jgi:ribosomal protein L37AE/L43A
VRRKYGGAYKLNEELFDVVLDLPATDMFAAPCPHCDETIVAHKRRNRGQGECPHCYRSVYFSGSAIGTSEWDARRREKKSGERDSAPKGEVHSTPLSSEGVTWVCDTCDEQKLKDQQTTSTKCNQCGRKMRKLNGKSGRSEGCFTVVAVFVFLFFMAQSCG